MNVGTMTITDCRSELARPRASIEMTIAQTVPEQANAAGDLAAALIAEALPQLLDRGVIGAGAKMTAAAGEIHLYLRIRPSLTVTELWGIRDLLFAIWEQLDSGGRIDAILAEVDAAGRAD
ncbi:MAG TPA: hypothetical protein VMY35_06460 [Phycisphaerae bacterium]|nr:hypothetical protein [Phycisphaerae bacterium]